MSTKAWYLKDLLGWISVKLDARTYEALDSLGSKLGVKTQNMIVEGDGGLVGEKNKVLTAEVLLKLVRDKLFYYYFELEYNIFKDFILKHPKNMLSDINTLSLPVLNSYYTEENLQNGIDPVYIQSKFLKVDKRYPILVIKNTYLVNHQY